ncbi:hypothetical protein B0T16DRAFT_395924, partial [Cercophora newfieldiana]
MAIVLVGDPEALKSLLAERHELGSLFPDRITFEDLSPRDCLKMLDKQMKDAKPTAMTPFFTSQAATKRFEKAISILSMFEGWGNAPLVKFIKTRMLQKADNEHFLAGSRDPTRKHTWKLTEEMAMSCLRTLFRDIRNTRAAIKKVSSEPSGNATEPRNPAGDPTPQPGPSGTNPTEATSETASEPKRVVHATQQLQKVAKETSSPTSEEGSKTLEKKTTQQAAAKKSDEKRIEKRDKNEKIDEEKNRSAQEAIKQLGKCEQGFDWDEADGGWVCQGGSHFLSDAEVAAAM